MSLEAILAAGGKKNFTASGPGPKTLIAGDSTLGYFGPVLVADLFTTSDMFNQYPEWLSVGTPMLGVNPQWQKFIINGKITYISLLPMYSVVQWNALYSQGLIYGTNDDGLIPATPAVNQFRPLSKREGGVDWVLTPRAYRLSPDDVLPTGTPISLDIAALVNIIKGGQGTALWASIAHPDSNYGWTLNTYTNTTSALIYGMAAGTSWGLKTGGLRYFPVLELQDATKVVFPIFQPNGTAQGLKQPTAVPTASFEDAVLPVDVTTMKFGQSALRQPLIDKATTGDMVEPITLVAYQQYYKQPRMTAKLS